MDDRQQRRKPLHLKTFDYTGGEPVYFVTICTAGRQPHFLSGDVAKAIVDELQYRRTADEITLYCYCIMPDHLHLLMSLRASYAKSLQKWISAYKRHASKVVSERYGINPLWQKNFHEHVVRKEESLLKTMEYILNNPVRKGIVDEWRAYPFSEMCDDVPM